MDIHIIPKLPYRGHIIEHLIKHNVPHEINSTGVIIPNCMMMAIERKILHLGFMSTVIEISMFQIEGVATGVK